jgi:hypothetical protein
MEEPAPRAWLPSAGSRGKLDALAFCEDHLSPAEVDSADVRLSMLDLPLSFSSAWN